MKPSIRELLHRSFDDPLSDIEQKSLEDALSESAELREERDHLITLRQDISEQAQESFGPWFVQRVMARVGAEPSGAANSDALVTQLMSMFRRAALVASIAGVLAVTYNLSQSEDLTVAATLGIQQEPTLEEMLDVTLALEAEELR